MVNDLANTAYMVVNHHLEEFTLVTNKKMHIGIGTTTTH